MTRRKRRWGNRRKRLQEGMKQQKMRQLKLTNRNKKNISS
jgi:hypothetical protein